MLSRRQPSGQCSRATLIPVSQGSLRPLMPRPSEVDRHARAQDPDPHTMHAGAKCGEISWGTDELVISPEHGPLPKTHRAGAPLVLTMTHGDGL